MKFIISLATAFSAVVAEAAVEDYVRTETLNYNGNPGLTLVTYVQEDVSHTGRAWIVKADLSYGYRMRAKCGNNAGNRATVGTMAEEVIAEGEKVVCAINADYFDMNQPTANSLGFVIDNGRLSYRGYEPFNFKWQQGWVNDRWHIIETADHEIVHEIPTAVEPMEHWTYLYTGTTPSTPIAATRPQYAWNMLSANGRKIYNTLETCWCNYPVRNGQLHIIGNGQDRNTYPRVMVGLGVNADAHKQLVLFLNDGRCPDWSYGVTDTDSAQMMIGEGCTDVAEFDGGGSAQMWVPNGTDSVYPKFTSTLGGYLNWSSEGSSGGGRGTRLRLDVTSFMLLAPRTHAKVASVVSGRHANPYERFEEALNAFAPWDTITVESPVAMTSDAFPQSGTVRNNDTGNHAAFPIARTSSLKVPSGRHNILVNLAFSGVKTADVESGGTLTLSGYTGLDRVNTADASGLHIYDDTLERELVVDCATATGDGANFALSENTGASGFVRSLRHLRCAGHPELFAKVVPISTTSCYFQWCNPIALPAPTVRVRRPEGAADVSVALTELDPQFADSGYRLRIAFSNETGAASVTGSLPVVSTGTYVFRTEGLEDPAAFKAGYRYFYRIEFVDENGTVVPNFVPASGELEMSDRRPWFFVRAEPETQTNGSWEPRPEISEGAYAVTEDSAFAASSLPNGRRRLTSQVTFAGFATQTELDAELARYATAGVPQSALVLGTDDDLAMTPVWFGLVASGGAPAWRKLYGPAAKDVAVTLVQEVDRSAPVVRVRYSSKLPDGELTELRDAAGNVWLDGAPSGASAGRVQLLGNGSVEFLQGDYLRKFSDGVFGMSTFIR